MSSLFRLERDPVDDGLPRLHDIVTPMMRIKDPTNVQLFKQFRKNRKKKDVFVFVYAIVMTYLLFISYAFSLDAGPKGLVGLLFSAFGPGLVGAILIFLDMTTPYLDHSLREKLEIVCGYLEHLFIVGTTLSFSYQILVSSNRHCDQSLTNLQCLAITMYQIPGIMLIFAMIIPTVFTLVMPTFRWLPIYAPWIVINGSVLFSVAYYNMTNAWLPLLLLLPISLRMLVCVHSQSLLLFMCSKERQKPEFALQIACEKRPFETHRMIGNVAHDLKTPLTSLMLGIDEVGNIMTDMQCVLEDLAGAEAVRSAVKPLIAHINDAIVSMSSCNSLMHMIINRCVDYTHVMSGIGLAPRSDVVQLWELLRSCVACMKNLSDGAASISLLHNNTAFRDSYDGYDVADTSGSSGSIFPIIVTDRQWLEDNVLCMLSNAIKFSVKDKKEVTINVTLTKKKKRLGDAASSEVGDVVGSSQQATPQSNRSQRSGQSHGASPSAVQLSSHLLLPASLQSRSSELPDETALLDSIPQQPVRKKPSPPASNKEPGDSLKQKPGPQKSAEGGSDKHHPPVRNLSHSTDVNDSFELNNSPTMFNTDHGTSFPFGSEKASAPTDRAPTTTRDGALQMESLEEAEKESESPTSPQDRTHLLSQGATANTTFAADLNTLPHTLPHTLLPPRITIPISRGKSFSVKSNAEIVGISTEYMIRIEVMDCGAALKDEKLQEMFLLLKQTDRNEGGTGLGMFCLAQRVKALKGSYGVHRRTDGQEGTVMWFEIPYKPSKSSKTAMEVAKRTPKAVIRTPKNGKTRASCSSNTYHELELQDIAEEDSVHENKSSSCGNSIKKPSPNNNIGSTSSKSLKEATAGVMHAPNNNNISTMTVNMKPGILLPQPSSLTQPLTILVVDDSMSILKMSSMMLRRQGHVLVTAENGAVAIERVTEMFAQTSYGFDVILMDLQMPVMDGLEATMRIRQLEDQAPCVRTSNDSLVSIALANHAANGGAASAAAAGGAKMPSQSVIEFRNAHASFNGDMASTATINRDYSLNYLSDRSLLKSNSSHSKDADSNRSSSKNDESGSRNGGNNVHRSILVSAAGISTKTETFSGKHKSQLRRHQFIIGISASTDQETIKGAFDAGIDKFIPKPFNLATFNDAYVELVGEQEDTYDAQRDADNAGDNAPCE